MNLEEYFTRIGFHGPYDKPDLATLKLIHKQHVMSLPFENLSIHCGERITMDLEVIFNKLVRSNRGGWCMENNFLFGWALREMGYDTVTFGSRVFNSAINDFGPNASHLINQVVIDGKAYITDVGFGVSCQVWEPLELVSGKDQPQAAGIFRLIDKGDIWVLEKTGRKPKVVNPEFAKSNLVSRVETKQIYCFTLLPCEFDHFLEMCLKLQTDPNTLFTNKSICSLQTPTGFRALLGWTYSEVTYNPEEGVDVLDMRDIPDEEIDQILREKFSIMLKDKLKPVNKTKYSSLRIHNSDFCIASLKGKMNLEEYFTRIGFHGPYDKPDLATLKLIHKQHVMSLPFENLSIHCGERITMDLEVIFNKLVRSNRGGWCMENNSLFGWVLREMGYDTVTFGSKVFHSTTNDFGPDDTHLINQVVIDGKAYITDVSFGVSYQVWEPLELVSGKDQPQAAGIFRLIDKGDIWVLEKTGRKPKVVNPEFAKSSLVNKEGTNPIYSFTLVPREADHFLETSNKLQIDPNTLFTNKSICSLQTPTGFRALIGWTYSEVTYKPEEGVDVFDMRNIPDEEIDQILREKFSIMLKDKLKPVNKTVCYTL
ncbi:hypothetical protein Q5P01_006195 [Channa striata]|uniref:arylamine N-acetyltransferase n=1 Tax=Channa striata TaxID=64152 RepID=A0AA88T0K3_CHASR|nr:hypothetical protein Q5P01_006195 [Channa striata]